MSTIAFNVHGKLEKVFIITKVINKCLLSINDFFPFAFLNKMSTNKHFAGLFIWLSKLVNLFEKAVYVGTVRY